MMLNHYIELIKHKILVFKFICKFIIKLFWRGIIHDNSKFKSNESKLFADVTPKLKSTTYGSDEYKKFLEYLKPALQHHYANNRHHPEYFNRCAYEGLGDMTMLDIIEMLCDWLAATKRHKDGNVYRSIQVNSGRFNYGYELYNIFYHTYKEDLEV